MKTKLMTALGAVVLAGAAIVGTLAFENNAGAQAETGYEYGYLLPVPRVESYETDLGRWAGKDDDKKYLQGHVFVYEEGATNFDRHVNSLRKVNELAGQGWELYDAQAGVLRRKK